MRTILMISVCSAIILLTSFTPTGIKRYELKTIIIDAGHGGHDPGTSGKISKEKDIALKIALKFGKYVEERMGNRCKIIILSCINDDISFGTNIGSEY